MPRIVFKKNEHAPVDMQDAVTVGRSEKHANVVVKDTRLSRAHCRFELRDDAWSVVDLGSQNGTFLNGRRVQQAMIKAGDVITIGTVDMLFEETGPGGNTVMAGVNSTRGSGLQLDEPDEPVAPGPSSADSTRTVVAPAALVLVTGSLADKIHPITHDPYNIGRKHDNQLCLENDGKSSGYHARIRRVGVDFVIEDLGSTNGVVVNGTRITGPVTLKPGMKVVLGSQVFKFQLHGKPEQSSGQTAPKLAGTDVRKRLEQARKEESKEDTSELDDDAAAPVGEASEADLREASQHDMAALTQRVKFTGGGGTVFAVAEVLMVVAVAGAIIFGAWKLTTTDSGTGGGGPGAYPPSRPGGLLSSNPSFDDRDDSGFPRGWRYSVSGTDNFNLVEGALGGQYCLQIGRFTPGNRVSVAVSDAMELKSAGVKVSVWAMNPEFGNDRLGTAVVQVWWLAHPREREPMAISPLVARTGMKEWTELVASARAPAGARAFCVAVGISGTPGSVTFDEVSVESDESAQPRMTAQSVTSPTGLTWELSSSGDIELSGPEGKLMRGGRALLYYAEGREDPLDPMQMLVEAPSLAVAGNEIQGSFHYFDPLAGSDIKLILTLGGKDAGATFSARLEPTATSDMSKASRFVSFSALAMPAWAPGELVRFEPGGTLPVAYSEEVGAAERGTIGRVLSADTGTGNVLESPNARAWATQAGGGRELLVQQANALNLTFVPGRDRDELSREVALVSSVAPGETQIERVNRALRILLEFTYNQAAIAAAAEAVDAASKHYRLRLIELRDAINVPALTRNEQLYRSAMQEAISTADSLRGNSAAWTEAIGQLMTNLDGRGMNRRSKETGKKAREALAQLAVVANDFNELADRARKSLFLLEVEIEQRDSEPFFVSAIDFLQSGQHVQGMLKLETVVNRYPRCLRGIEAKERLADVAEILLNEAAAFDKQNLKKIAQDNALQARALIKLVRSRLLTLLLNEEQKRWLRDLPVSAETPPSMWMDRESQLARRLQALEAKLPAGLPEDG